MQELELFAAAIEIADPAERARLLERECAGQPELEQRMKELLAAHFRPQSFVDPVEVNHAAFGPGVEATTNQDSTTAGAVIAGRYTLLESIGEGGMGQVWVAQQSAPVKRKVAIKLIKAGMDSKAVLARFEAERQALAVMDHPNIAKVLDGGTTSEGRPFFVMELVRGIPITEYCDQVQFSVRERLELFGQVCSAVQHAHQKGIIHRDLKPSNILVTEHDGRPVTKVIDFGLAKALHGAHALTDISLHTSFGAVIGTPLYMAPEQLGTSALDVDTRSDLYSLGVILYELLTGSTPIERQRLKEAAWDEIRRIVLEEEPQLPSTRLSSSGSLPSLAARRHVEPAKLTKLIRGELDWIIMKTLEKDRNRRYETASALSQDIERYLTGEAVLAAPPSRIYRLRKFARRHRGPVIAGSLLLLALVAGIAGTSYGLVLARQSANAERLAKVDAQNKRTEAEKQRSRAEQREQEAIDAVQRFGDAVANNPDLKNSSQFETLRTTLLKEPLAYFRSLRERLQADRDTRPAALARLARAAHQLGLLTREIGNRQDALQALEESRTILERLARENASRSDFQQDLATTYNNIGLLLRDISKPAEALANYERAQAIQERLVRENRTSTRFQSDLARTYGNIGNLLSEIGKQTEALAACEHAREIQERLARENPRATDLQRDLAKTYLNIGNLRRASGKPAEALAIYEQATAIPEPLARDNPTVTDFQSDLATTYNNIGLLLRHTRKPAEALAAYEQARAIQERLARDNPSVTDFQSELALSYNSIALLLRDVGKPVEAFATYEQAKAIQERLARDNPSVTDFQGDLAMSYNNIGNLHGNTGKPAEALVAYERAQAILERLVREDRTSTRFQSDLAKAHGNIGLLLRGTGKPAEALAAYEQAKAIQERLARDNRNVAAFQGDLAKSLGHIGNLLSETGKPAEALAAYEQAKAILERLPPTLTLLQSDLADTYNNIGALLSDTSKSDEALAAFQQARAIQERLVKENSTVTEYKISLGATLNNLATFRMNSRRFSEARDLLQEAVQHQRRALVDNPRHPTCRQFLKNHYTNLLLSAAGLDDESLAGEARRGLAELAANDPQAVALDLRIARVLGGDKAQGTDEFLQFGQRAYDLQRFALAARFFNDALTGDSSLAENRQAQVAYNAACCAALAAAGQDVEEPPLDENAKAQLRGQALAWLQSELDRWNHLLQSASAEQRQVVISTLMDWQQDLDLSSVRGDAIETLPEAERDAWRALWIRVKVLESHSQ